ncbi:hypothetical protein LEMLEM_LOCUS14165 [Lemmus lemmus]
MEASKGTELKDDYIKGGLARAAYRIQFSQLPSITRLHPLKVPTDPQASNHASTTQT